MPAQAYPTSGPVRSPQRHSRSATVLQFPDRGYHERMATRSARSTLRTVTGPLSRIAPWLKLLDAVQYIAGLNQRVAFSVPPGWGHCWDCASNGLPIVGIIRQSAVACIPQTCAEGQALVNSSTYRSAALCQESTLLVNRVHILKYWVNNNIGDPAPAPGWRVWPRTNHAIAMGLNIRPGVEPWTQPRPMPFEAMPYVKDSPVRETGPKPEPTATTWESTQLFPRVEPAADPHPQTNPKPPRPRTRERKVRLGRSMSVAFRAIKWAINGLTESADVIMALWKAIPKDVRDRFISDYLDRHGEPPKLPAQALFVYEHFGDIDLEDALRNLVNNQIEDFIFGWIGSRIAKGTQENPFWSSPAGPQTGTSNRQKAAPVKGKNPLIPQFNEQWEIEWF